MNDKDREMIGIAWMEMYDSLHQATMQAGGSGSAFDSKGLQKMTVTDLFNHLATNKVRFYCTKTHELVKKAQITVHGGCIK